MKCMQMQNARKLRTMHPLMHVFIMRRKNMKCMQMQNARKFAYNASFDACVHNAARMKLNDVSCIVREFNGDAPPTT